MKVTLTGSNTAFPLTPLTLLPILSFHRLFYDYIGSEVCPSCRCCTYAYELFSTLELYRSWVGQGLTARRLWSEGRKFRVGCWLVTVFGVEEAEFRVACWLVAVCRVGRFRVGCYLMVVYGVDGGGRGFRIGGWLASVCGVKGGGFRVPCFLVVLCGIKGECGGYQLP